jgi:peptidoglycan/xylan/chitin deacetylase (PgdA/CDA1 family)
MRADRCLTLSFFEPLRRAGFGATDRCLPVLMYHSISDDSEPGIHPYYRVTTSPSRFAEQMQWLADGGWTGVSLEQALSRPANGQGDDRRAAAITFDDGFRDFYTEAWPVLQEHRFAATMYLPTAFISRRRESWRGKECLTWTEVRELRAGGVQFGSHTATHQKLYKLPWNAIEHEVTISKACLQQELREDIASFAYPYAFPQEDRSFTTKFMELLLDHGYHSCVTTVIGRIRGADHHLCLKRLPVNSCDDKALFLAKLNGAYDWLGSVQLACRQMKRGTARGKTAKN